MHILGQTRLHEECMGLCWPNDWLYSPSANLDPYFHSTGNQQRVRHRWSSVPCWYISYRATMSGNFRLVHWFQFNCRVCVSVTVVWMPTRATQAVNGNIKLCMNCMCLNDMRFTQDRTERFCQYSSGLLHWHRGNHAIAPVPVKQPWRI